MAADRRCPIEVCPISPSRDSGLDTGSHLDRDTAAMGNRLLSLAADRIGAGTRALAGDTVDGSCSPPTCLSRVCRRPGTSGIRTGGRKRGGVPIPASRGSPAPASSPPATGSSSRLDWRRSVWPRGNPPSSCPRATRVFVGWPDAPARCSAKGCSDCPRRCRSAAALAA